MFLRRHLHRISTLIPRRCYDSPRSCSSLASGTVKYRTPSPTINPTTSSTRHSIMDSLKVHNSLQPGGPVPFVPIQPGKISWYACGPTVYDHSHLGHARNYVSTDIIRRILKDYFKFDVKFVMNITDIDDKIILKARRQRLLELEKQKSYTDAELLDLATKAFDQYAQSNLPELLKAGDLTAANYPQRRDEAYKNVLSGKSVDGESKPGDAEAKIKMHLANLDTAAEAIQTQKVWGGADEVLLPYLDSLYKESVDARDHEIFTSVTKYWEGQFMDDMDALNVLRPDVVTRVTEYVPQIVDFVKKIVDKGFAYEADGSIYFDIAAFEKAGNTYAHLRPESKNDQSLQAEGEGSLSKNLGNKRGAGDFALWKKSKAGEPSWPSPWGEGRPGWHIECSVMASDILGSQMDIHSGGIDLAFPHHDNELAQSEAYYCEHGPHTWVNYFLHMGHLSIAGSKMSKSLKNFQTVKDALATGYTSRNMRIVFLMGRWNDGVEISPDMRVQADSWESSVTNFFVVVKSLLNEANVSGVENDLKDLSVSKEPSEIEKALQKAELDFQNALADSFDTPKAMKVIYDLVRDANVFLSSHSELADIRGVEKAARWITKIVGILGLDSNAKAPYDGLGWASASIGKIDPKEAVKPYEEVYNNIIVAVKSLDAHSDVLDQLLSEDVGAEFASVVSTGASDLESIALPYVRSVARIRDELRKLAPSSASKKEILGLSDRIRDFDLTNLGVYLDDRTDKPSLIKFIPAAELIAAREEKAAKEAEKAAAKEAARLAREKLEAERAAKARVSPRDMFRGDERFSEWDADGLPTKMKDGEEVNKSMAKKLKKEWDTQKKLHDKYNKA